MSDRYNRSFHIAGPVYSGADRHNGEIVAFYLSLLLDLRRTPVAVGRRVNLNLEIYDKANPDLKKTFYKKSKTKIVGVNLDIGWNFMYIFFFQVKISSVFMEFVNIVHQSSVFAQTMIF